MKLFLSIVVLVSLGKSLAQSTPSWSITSRIMYWDNTLFEIDSGRTSGVTKVGKWETYRYSTKGGPRKLVSRQEFNNSQCLKQKYCNHSPEGNFSCQEDSLDVNGRVVFSRYSINDKMLWEKQPRPNRKLYTKYYSQSGKLSGKGYEKTYVLKGKGRCAADIHLSKKIGFWKYYRENGRRRYFKFWDNG